MTENVVMKMDEVAGLLCKTAREHGWALRKFTLEKIEQHTEKC